MLKRLKWKALPYYRTCKLIVSFTEGLALFLQLWSMSWRGGCRTLTLLCQALGKALSIHEGRTLASCYEKKTVFWCDQKTAGTGLGNNILISVHAFGPLGTTHCYVLPSFHAKNRSSHCTLFAFQEIFLVQSFGETETHTNTLDLVVLVSFDEEYWKLPRRKRAEGPWAGATVRQGTSSSGFPPGSRQHMADCLETDSLGNSGYVFSCLMGGPWIWWLQKSMKMFL